MTAPNYSRRSFVKASAGGLVISASLASSDTRASDLQDKNQISNPVTGDVLQTRGRLSCDASHLIEQERSIPVKGKTDVLVCGGGPAGVAAALAAARAGASVQLIEVAGCLGGVWTAGLLTKILDSGNKSGIMAELLKEFSTRGSAVAKQTDGTVYDLSLIHI